MYIATLRRLVDSLPESTPGLSEFESRLRSGKRPRPVWYRSQKEHLQGWLSEYEGPGAYGRKGGFGRDAEFLYNHFQCAPGLFWLAEAAGVSHDRLKAATAAAEKAGPNYARQCAAVRREIPWSEVEARLLAMPMTSRW